MGQRTILEKPAVSNAKQNGFSFDPAPMGFIYTGSLQILGATGAERWQVSVNNQPRGDFFGSDIFGPIQWGTNETLTIAYTGEFSMTLNPPNVGGLFPGPYTAIFTGSLDAEGSVPYVFPMPVATSSILIDPLTGEPIGSVGFDSPPIKVLPYPSTFGFGGDSESMATNNGAGLVSTELVSATPGGFGLWIKDLSISPGFVGQPAAGTFVAIVSDANANLKYLQKISPIAGADLSVSRECNFVISGHGLLFISNAGAGNPVYATVVYRTVPA